MLHLVGLSFQGRLGVLLLQSQLPTRIDASIEDAHCLTTYIEGYGVRFLNV